MAYLNDGTKYAVIFDGDDTLWLNQTFYEDAKEKIDPRYPNENRLYSTSGGF